VEPRPRRPGIPQDAETAQGLGVHVHSLELRRADELDAAFAEAAAEGAEAIIVVSSRLMSQNRKRIVELAAGRRVILVSGWGPWARDGALFSYGPDISAVFARAAYHVDKVLKGAKPADLPVEQPTRFDLVVNATTARSLGLTLSEAFLARADEVIE
jgi:putative tryptophan/tyrosine transport system substrate-binding protein